MQPSACVVVIWSEIHLGVTKPFNCSQFCSFLLNRSIQENGELKIESKIEEVSLFSRVCSSFSCLFVHFSPFACAGVFIVAA